MKEGRMIQNNGEDDRNYSSPSGTNSPSLCVCVCRQIHVFVWVHLLFIFNLHVNVYSLFLSDSCWYVVIPVTLEQE